MKIPPSVTAFLAAAFIVGCQHPQKSASMSRDQTDNEVTLKATSDNTSVQSDGKSARLETTGGTDSGMNSSERMAATGKTSDRIYSTGTSSSSKAGAGGSEAPD